MAPCLCLATLALRAASAGDYSKSHYRSSSRHRCVGIEVNKGSSSGDADCGARCIHQTSTDDDETAC